MPGYPSLLDLTSLGSFGFLLRGQEPNRDAGFAVSSAGDINGDGYADFIVGAPLAGEAAQGSAYVVFGKASGFGTTFLGSLTPTEGFSIRGGGVDRDMIGISVSSAGDINNDGYDDIIVGADHVGGQDQGAAYVMFGKASGFTNIQVGTLAASDGFMISGNGNIGRLGHSVASAGDYNNDGYDDIIIGAPDGNVRNSGNAYLIFGKAGGFGPINVLSLSPTDGFAITGAGVVDRMGTSVSAGDINNDGYDDLIIGAPLNDSGGTDSGAVYVLFGKAAGFAPIDLAVLAPADGFKIQGMAFDNAGTAVSTVGDFNGDGFDDLIVGAPTVSRTGQSDVGEAYLVFGKAGGFGTVDLGALAPADGFKLINTGEFDFAGSAVSGAGDINGDGYDDLLVGVAGADSDGNDAGEVYVVFGKASGFGPVDLSLLTATEGFRIRGDATGDHAGNGAAGAGDINNDGFDDIIVGSPDALGSHEGAAYVIFGRSTVGTPTLDNGATDSRFSTSYTEDQAPIPIVASDVVLTSGAPIGSMTVAGGLLTLAAGSLPAGISASGVGTGTIIFSGSASPADYASALAMVRFSVGGDNPTNFGTDPSRTVVISVDAGLGPQLIGVTEVAITGIDDPAVARNDDFETPENANGSGSVLTNNGHGADSDPDTMGALTVTQVNGSMANVGMSFLLPSGAILRLNSSGSFTYEPNHAFDATPAPGSGATNQPAYDAFTYTLAGGSTATVTMTIAGVDTADFLIGPAGPNTLAGGASSDVYLLDHPGDLVVEEAGGGNRDVVYVQTSYTLRENVYVEVLSASHQAGTAPLELIGNGIAQEIYGNAGANFIEGNGGADLLSGLLGNDVYVVASADDYVFENLGAGRDVVYARTSYALNAGQEVEVLSTQSQAGTTAIDLTGNELVNELYGNAGANMLNGGAGADYLLGFGGADSFAFTTALGGGNVDEIGDFVSGTDRIALDDAVFTGLGPGALSASAFVTGSQAQDADDRIVYNSATGQLFFDADGNGAGAAMLFAVLDGHPPIAASDFIVI